MSIGHNIKALRMEKGLSQRQLAELIGTARQYITNIENNRKTPSIRLLAQIADALETDLKTLIACKITESSDF